MSAGEFLVVGAVAAVALVVTVHRGPDHPSAGRTLLEALFVGVAISCGMAAAALLLFGSSS